MKVLHALAGAALLALPLGCGDTLGLTDGGARDMGQVYKLVSGEYQVTSLTNKQDACKIDDGTIQGAKFTLTNDGSGNVTLKGFGAGTVLFNTGDLVGMGHQKAGATCEYDYRSKVHVTVTADNEFDADYSEDDTAHKAACVPVNTDCHTQWTMHLKKS